MIEHVSEVEVDSVVRDILRTHGKSPWQDFDMEEFERSCKTPFMLRCFPAVAREALRRPFMSVSAPLAGSLSAVAVLGAVACLWTKKR